MKAATETETSWNFKPKTHLTTFEASDLSKLHGGTYTVFQLQTEFEIIHIYIA